MRSLERQVAALCRIIAVKVCAAVRMSTVKSLSGVLICM